MSKNINKLMWSGEPLIKKSVSRAPYPWRDEIAQEMRIRLWRLIENKYDESEDIKVFVSRYINLIYKTSLNEIAANNTQRAKKFIDIDSFHDSLFVDDFAKNILSVEAKELLTTLLVCLSEDEKFIINYIVNSCGSVINYDSLNRQFGYSGKNAMRFILDKIFLKMKNYASELNIEVSF